MIIIYFRSRQTNDRGTERILNTIDHQTLRQRLEDIMNNPKYTLRYDEHEAVLNSEVREQFDNLLVHVDKGCLSNIPPCGTTSTNENLHHKINKFFSSENMGPALAAALLGFFVYSWNCQRVGEEEDKCHLKTKKKKAVKSVRRNNDCGAPYGQNTSRFNEQETFSSPFLIKLNVFRNLKSSKKDKSLWIGGPFAICYKWTTKDVMHGKNDCPLEHTLESFGMMKELVVPVSEFTLADALGYEISKETRFEKTTQQNTNNLTTLIDFKNDENALQSCANRMRAAIVVYLPNLKVQFSTFFPMVVESNYRSYHLAYEDGVFHPVTASPLNTTTTGDIFTKKVSFSTH